MIGQVELNRHAAMHLKVIVAAKVLGNIRGTDGAAGCAGFVITETGSADAADHLKGNLLVRTGW